jgi:hypothetical protein
MPDITIQDEITKLPPGERYAMRISRIMGSWRFIGILGGVIGCFCIHYHLWDGSILDVFNLAISLYTLLVDIIILKANNTLNDSFILILNKIISLEETIISLEKSIIAFCETIINNQENQEKILLEQTALLNQILARLPHDAP